MFSIPVAPVLPFMDGDIENGEPEEFGDVGSENISDNSPPSEATAPLGLLGVPAKFMAITAQMMANAHVPPAASSSNV